MLTEKNAKHLKIAMLIAALLLCVAVLPNIAYGYFSFLRLVVCIVAGTAAFMLRDHERLDKHLVPLVILALLFNPAVPFHFSRELWLFVDLGTAVYFLTLSKKI